MYEQRTYEAGAYNLRNIYVLSVCFQFEMGGNLGERETEQAKQINRETDKEEEKTIHCMLCYKCWSIARERESERAKRENFSYSLLISNTK